MGLTMELDLTGQESREQMEAGDRIAVGWYRGVVDDHLDDRNNDGQYMLVCRVEGAGYDPAAKRPIAGFDGKKTKYFFSDPRTVDADKQKKALDRVQMLASRLNLVRDDQLGKPGVAIDFDQAVGTAIVFQIEVNTWDEKDELGQVVGKKSTHRIAYAGIYPPDHEKIPADVREALKLPPARTKGSAGGPSNGTSAGGSTPTAPASQPAKPDPFANL